MATNAPITGAQTRAPFIPVPNSGSADRHLHLTAIPPRVASRRDLLSFGSAAVAIGAAAVVGATALVSDVAAISPSAFAIGHARYRAAETRFNSFSGLNKFEAEREEDAYIAEWRAFKELRPSNLTEFAQAFLVYTDDGTFELPDAVCVRMVADAKRLTGAA